MKKIFLIGALVLSSANAANWTLIRRVAQVAGCAASMVDARTTLRAGLVETNPLLGSGKPQAGRIISLKLGMCAGQIVASELHRSARKDKIGAVSGIGQAGMYGALALHNSELK